eukprot:TRINITY_DN28883_c0_g1_i1.p1 TRINITY_DN28883_c0_g1~~TRINITY_DN28883_c0_g1_i1.p1  ORF type:complete len:344 (+),score=60.02 TRINITY_DN28883_c0_g1_i1:31-1032(+)
MAPRRQGRPSRTQQRGSTPVIWLPSVAAVALAFPTLGKTFAMIIDPNSPAGILRQAVSTFTVRQRPSPERVLQALAKINRYKPDEGNLVVQKLTKPRDGLWKVWRLTYVASKDQMAAARGNTQTLPGIYVDSFINYEQSFEVEQTVENIGARSRGSEIYNTKLARSSIKREGISGNLLGGTATVATGVSVAAAIAGVAGVISTGGSSEFALLALAVAAAATAAASAASANASAARFFLGDVARYKWSEPEAKSTMVVESKARVLQAFDQEWLFPAQGVMPGPDGDKAFQEAPAPKLNAGGPLTTVRYLYVDDNIAVAQAETGGVALYGATDSV